MCIQWRKNTINDLPCLKCDSGINIIVDSDELTGNTFIESTIESLGEVVIDIKIGRTKVEVGVTLIVRQAVYIKVARIWEF